MATLVHTAPHPLSGQVVTLEMPTRPNVRLLTRHMPSTALNGADYVVEDWCDRLGIDWVQSTDGWAVIYTMRLTFMRLPVNQDVVAGWIGLERFLAHVTELRYDGDLLGDLDVTSF